MGGAHSSYSSASKSGSSTKITTKTVQQKKTNGAHNATTTTTAAGVASSTPHPVENGWSSPYRFRELYDESSGELQLHSNATSPSLVLRLAAEHAMRDHMNEVFFGLATHTQWQQQQIRGLFAVYKKACLLTPDRVLNYKAFCLLFFPLSSHHHFPPRVIRKLYSTVFDVDKDGMLSFPDFVVGISRCVHGRRRHKMRLVFDVFNVSGSGEWSFKEAADFLRTGMLYVKHLTLDSLEEIDMRDMLQEQQFEWWHQELATMQHHMESESQDPLSAASPSPVGTAPIPKPSPATLSSPSRFITFNAFRSWATRLFRFRPFLARFDVLLTPEQEAQQIKSLWSDDGVKVGEQWFVMSETWWRSWKTYTGFKEPGEEDPKEAAAAAMKKKQSGLGASPGSNGATSDLLSPPYLISDTDTDSDRDTCSPNGARAPAVPVIPSSAPQTPQKAVRRSLSGLTSSPNSVLLQEKTPASSPTQPTVVTTKVGNTKIHVSSETTVAASAAIAGALPDSRRQSVSGGAPPSNHNGISIHLAPISSAVAPNPATATPMFSAMSPSPSPGAANGAVRSSSLRSAASAARAALRPTAIDNSDLTSPSNPLLLRQPLVEHEDFILLSSSIWHQLTSWYGLLSPHTAFPREVISVGKDGARRTRVEVYPMCVRVKRVGKDAPKPLPHPGVPADGACVLISDPAHMTVKDLEAKLIELFYSPQAVSESKGKSSSSSSSKDRSKPLTKDVLTAFDPTLRSLRIWLRDGNDWRCLLLDDFGKTLEQVDIQQEDVLLVELERARKSGSSAPPSWYMDRRSIPRRWDQFHVGDSIDARDKQAIWYASVVKSVAGQPGALATDTAGTLRVHFVGWDEKWDELISVTSICHCRGPCACSGRLAAPGAQIRFKKLNPSSTSNDPESAHPSSNSPTAIQKGLCGLQNLGNTCFMNSTLQCLSNTPFFISNYFLPAKHLSEVNKSNPLGHKGLLAMEFGNLVKEMWSGEYRALAPSKFKRVISDFAPQFDGYAQHDSHELLAFLLDGIHEDLNRVTKKVPTPAVESNGRSDQIVVRESWATYKIRNQSIVVDLFMGMLKSTVICPEPSCGRVSITFDPFRYLTVPLPQFNDRQLILTLCSQSNTPLVNYGIILPEHATVAQLKERLANLCGLAVHRLLICDVHKSKLYRVLMDSKRVSTIRETDVLVAYEILPEAFQSVVTPSTSVAGGSSISVSSNSSSGSSSSNNSSSLTYAAVASPVPQLRDNMVYLQAIHKSILVDARGNQTMSPRFGIPICLTTTPQLSNLRIHQLVAQAIERWTPIIPGRKELPYTVRVVDHTCSRCGFCSESSNCGGCCLPETDRPCGLDGGFALCILWETDVIARMVKTSMDDAHIIDHASVALKVRTDNSVTLAECLDLFSSKETLSKEDAWYCSGKCKTFRQATKQLQLFHCPEVLVVHLKRFLQINRIRREKQTTLVDFPIKGLDLSPFVPPHALEGEAYPIYDLYAVSNHAGGLSGGHYTSFVQASGRWYLFDDSRVSEVPVANIKTQYAYCLFYRRRA